MIFPPVFHCSWNMSTCAWSLCQVENFWERSSYITLYQKTYQLITMVTESDIKSSNRSSKMPQLVRLPCDLETWPLIQGALSRLKQVSRTDELAQILDHVHDLVHGNSKVVKSGRRGAKSFYAGLVNFLDNIASMERRGLFFRQTLPMIVDVALDIQELRPKNGFYYSIQQRGMEKTITKTRQVQNFCFLKVKFCFLPHLCIFFHA